MKVFNLDRRRDAEKAYWANVRSGTGERRIVPAEVQANELRPCFEGSGDLYSENRFFFHSVLNNEWKNKYVLDYACGQGNWSIYFALTGARRVAGFDMDSVGIEAARSGAMSHGIANKCQFLEADASNLPFPDSEFEIVIGTAALHHTIKYDNIFEELFRVMKPGSKAFFLENLADFPLWRLHWWIKGQVPEGDVPIFSKEVRQKSRMFSKCEIIGDTLVHSLKHFLWKEGRMKPWRRSLLRSTWSVDQKIFRTFPGLRRWGCFSIIVLTK